MKNKKRNKIVKAGVIGGLLSCMVFVILILATINPSVVDNQDVEVKKLVWREVILPFLGDNNPGTGASGIMYSWVNATGDGYTDNVTSEYAKGDDNNTHIGSDVPYGTAFDAGILIRWNKTHAWDSTWNLSLVRAYANCTVLSVSGIAMVEAQVATSADYLYVNYFLRDSDGGAGSGFTITEGQNVISFSVNFESLFYP